MLKYRGSSLVEYIIPVAVIALVVGVGLLYMLNDGSILSFASQTSNMEVDKSKQSGVINPYKGDSFLVNPNPGDLGGSLENPVGQCKDGYCVIDYGKYVISNIPQQFDEFVQTSGAAGSVEKMSSYLKKMAENMHDQGSIDLANEITTLASIGHNIALIMQEYERIYNLCSGDSVCISGYDSLPFPMPEGYDESVLSFPADATYATMLDSGAFGDVLNGENSSPLASAYVDQFNLIMDSSTLDDPTKGVIQELSWNIGMLGQDFQTNYGLLTGQTVNYYDPITGLPATPVDSVFANPVEGFENYSASRLTNTYSSLICATGYGEDTGTTCH
jgi:hypothetical protein